MRPAILAALILLAALSGPPARAETDIRTVQASWKEVLKGIDDDLERRAAEVDSVRQSLPELLYQGRRALSALDNRLTQAVILGGVAGETPWAYRTLLAQFHSVVLAADEDSRNLRLTREHLGKIKEENATLREIRRKGGENTYNDATVAALEEPGRRMEAIKSDVDGLKEQVDRALGEFDAIRHRAAKERAGVVEDYIRLFKEHFFFPVRPPLDSYGLVLLLRAATDWSGDFPRFVGPVLSGTRWDALTGSTLAVWVALLLAGRLAAGLGGPREDDGAQGDGAQSEGAAWGSRLGWPLLSLTLALALATRLAPFTASHIVYLGLTAPGALGITLLTRHRLARGVLDFWLVLYCAGVAVQMLALPAELAGPVWCAAAGAAAWERWRRGLRLTAACLGALALGALCGFGPMAVMACQAWFLVRLAMAVALSLKALLARRGGTWVRFVTPLAMTLTAVACLAWILLFMGGPGFVDYVFELELELGKARLSLDAVAAMVVLFFATRLGLAWLAAFLDGPSPAGPRLDPALSHTLGILASYVCWTVFLLACLHVLGLPLSGLTWIASGLSVGVGFGLKDIINNFVSGLIILFGGSIKKGDIVQTGKLLGEVTAVSVRNTTVRTLDNSMVIIPNSSFLKGEIINWSYQDKRIRLTIPVSVAPGTKIKKVRKILVAEASRHDKVLKEPAPSVVMRQFGRYGLDFELYVWIEDFRDKFNVESDLASALDRALQENKITVAFQGIKVKYKPRGSEEAQREAAREALREKRRQVFSLVRPLRRVHMRARWGVSVQSVGKEES